MSLRSRLISIMGIFSIIATLFIGVTSYKLSEQNAIREIKNKGELLVTTMMSHRKYFKHQQHPLIQELVEQDRFYPELMCGFAITRGVWDIFKADYSGFHFKQASVDPLYFENKADDTELQLIETFKKRADLERLEGIISKGDEQFFYIALPAKVDNKSCLRCHGDPATAPKDQVEMYGTENGYNWELGDTVSTFIVYVSIQKAMQQARQTAGILFLAGLGSFFIVLLGLGIFMNRKIIGPVEYLSERTEEISRGMYLDERLEEQKNDEIGVLAEAIEYLRLTVSKKAKRRSDDA
ncbi:MAG: DUF3365 domain-containing protein [Desulfobulbaceae bacterium]|nr:DUF3365 domain-containing protein [Desulfobulbaceae bacterium]